MNVELPPPQATVETGRFVMRPLRASDEGPISVYAGDERVARMTRSIPHPMPPGAVAALIARAQNRDRVTDVWALDGSATGGAEVMGLIELTRVDRDQSEVSFWVAPAFWNAGVARAAVQALIDANPHGARTLFAEVFQDNPASARVLTHCGFAYLGDAESFSVARGAKVPTWTYTRKLS